MIADDEGDCFGSYRDQLFDAECENARLRDHITRLEERLDRYPPHDEYENAMSKLLDLRKAFNEAWEELARIRCYDDEDRPQDDEVLLKMLLHEERLKGWEKEAWEAAAAEIDEQILRCLITAHSLQDGLPQVGGPSKHDTDPDHTDPDHHPGPAQAGGD